MTINAVDISMTVGAGGVLAQIPAPPAADSMPNTQIFLEEANDASFGSRGWFDNTAAITIDSENSGQNSSTNSIIASFDQTDTEPSWVRMRKNIDPAQNIYLSFWTKRSANWVGSQAAYHPHEFFFTTTKDGEFSGLQGGIATQLTLYVEVNGLTPQMGYGNINFPTNGNEIMYQSSSDLTVDTWHHIEAFIQLNSYDSVGGTSLESNGIFRMWLDGTQVIDVTNATPIAGQANVDAKIDQIILSPYIGDGSPLAGTQSIYYDQIKLSRGALISTDLYYGQNAVQSGAGGGTDVCPISGKDPMIVWNWGGGVGVSGNYTESTALAKSANGSNTGGARFWIGDGTNNQSGEIAIDFGEQRNELWIRYYHRYQSGFSWSQGANPNYDKNFYLWDDWDVKDLSIQPQYHSNPGTWAISLLFNNDPYQMTDSSNTSWDGVFGDGEWHLIEFYLKMDTNGTDGEGKLWIDGTRLINATGVDYSDGSSSARAGVAFIEFMSNQDTPNNGSPEYNDVTDLEIWDSTPPNTDAFGDPWIGPLNGYTGGA